MPRRLAAVLAVLALAVLGGQLAVSDDPGTSGAVSATVTRVVDGDTVHVELDGADETVRYIGVDTPESVQPGTPVECFAKRASTRNAALVAGAEVRLRFDVERRDRYGRLLAYVHRADDGTFVNGRLVAGGYARALTVPPNVRHADRFARLARAARAAGRGLWRAC